MKKTLKIALFSLLTLIALTFVCSASDYSFSIIDDDPSFTNENGIMCNYDSITFSYNNYPINLQFVQIADIGISNIFVYCSNIEQYLTFVDDNVPMGSDDVMFSQYILDEIISINFQASDLSDVWYSQGVLSRLFEDGLSFMKSFENAFDDGYDSGYDIGYDVGYNEGYTQGTYNGMQETESLKVGLLTILSAPFYVLGGILDFEILGINLFNIITGLLTVCLFAFVVKRLINGGV